MRYLFFAASLVFSAFFSNAAALNRCDLNVKINPLNHSVSGSFVFRTDSAGEIEFHTGNLGLKNAGDLMKQSGAEYDSRSGKYKFKKSPAKIEFLFEGVFPGSKSPGEPEDEISERGIFLAGIWYPVPAELCEYSFRADLPGGYTAVSEADSVFVSEENKVKRFHFTLKRPIERVTLSASREFSVKSTKLGSVEISVYFKKGNEDLIQIYLDNASLFIKLYQEMLGRYPYRRFAVVENFLPTGYSMPTYTLIGSRIIRLPFIPETSLGHEILHQWFGNSVFIDESHGNWAEGLTTYLSDHFYEDMEKRGPQYRKSQLLDYRTYAKEDFPPSEFLSPRSQKDRSVGYGKVSLFFNMLKNITGEKKFLESLRLVIKEKSFQKASYKDFQNAFEKTSRKNLDQFFQSWITSSGMPELSLDQIQIREKMVGSVLTFRLEQKGSAVFSMPVFVTVLSEGRRKRYRLLLNEKSSEYAIYLKRKPDAVLLDESYDTARTLSDNEIPLRLADFYSREPEVIIVPASLKESYGVILSMFPSAEVIAPEQAANAHLNKNCLVLDYKNPYLYRLFDLDTYEYEGTSFFIRKNILNSDKYFAYFHSDEKEKIGEYYRRSSHYGKYSDLVFDKKGTVTVKELYDTQSGLVYHLEQEISESEKIPWAGPFSELPEKPHKEKIVFVGEQHNDVNHHANQLEIVKKIHAENKKKTAIGLEMFQIHQQEILNLYIQNKISEREFLERSRYFEIWGYDYRFYREIIEYARKNKLDIIALNQKTEIVRKVARTGLDSLSSEERQMLPAEMDLTDNLYKKRLKAVFESHDFQGKMNFENFYAAQILWDETMANSLHQYLQKNPDHSVVVIAGNGHLKGGAGIPRRFQKRSGKSGSIILQDETLKINEADYIIYNYPWRELATLFKGIEIKTDDTGVTVKSAGEVKTGEDGLRKGDRILRMNGNTVKDMHDYRLEKYSCEMKKSCEITVMRDNEEISVKLNGGE